MQVAKMRQSVDLTHQLLIETAKRWRKTVHRLAGTGCHKCFSAQYFATWQRPFVKKRDF
jgi:hypothetical protein